MVGLGEAGKGMGSALTLRERTACAYFATFKRNSGVQFGAGAPCRLCALKTSHAFVNSKHSSRFRASKFAQSLGFSLEMCG